MQTLSPAAAPVVVREVGLRDGLQSIACTLPGLVVSVLVPSLKGAARAIASGAPAMLPAPSAGHVHSLGGIDGCPHAPGASGQVATEDRAGLFASMGLAAGLDFGRLMSRCERLAGWRSGEPLQGAVSRAGLPEAMIAQAA